MTTNSLAPIHPGEILREEFLAPLYLTAYALAKACHVPRTMFKRLVHEGAGEAGHGVAAWPVFRHLT
jgi:addiction module HigA family antidote